MNFQDSKEWKKYVWPKTGRHRILKHHGFVKMADVAVDVFLIYLNRFTKEHDFGHARKVFEVLTSKEADKFDDIVMIDDEARLGKKHLHVAAKNGHTLVVHLLLKNHTKLLKNKINGTLFIWQLKMDTALVGNVDLLLSSHIPSGNIIVDLEQSEHKTITANRVSCVCGCWYTTPIIIAPDLLIPVQSRFDIGKITFDAHNFDSLKAGLEIVSEQLESNLTELTHSVASALHYGLETVGIFSCHS